MKGGGRNDDVDEFGLGVGETRGLTEGEGFGELLGDRRGEGSGKSSASSSSAIAVGEDAFLWNEGFAIESSEK